MRRFRVLPQLPTLHSAIFKISSALRAMTVPGRPGSPKMEMVLKSLQERFNGPVQLVFVSETRSLMDEGRRHSRMYAFYLEFRHSLMIVGSVTTIPDNTVQQLHFLDPATGNNQTCTTNCPLSTDSSVLYQDFTFNNPVSLTGVQVTLTEWQGAG